MQLPLLILSLICATVVALDGGDSKFMKDYAMLKIYESCFGTALLKQITRELRDAYAKCSTAPSVKPVPNSPLPPILLSKLPPGFSMDPSSQTITKPTDGAASNHPENDLSNQDDSLQPQKPQMGGVLSFRPNTPFPQQPAVPPYMMPSMQPNQYQPFNQAPFYQFPYQSPRVFYPPYNPYYPQAQQYQQPFYQQPFFGNNRMSKIYKANNGCPYGAYEAGPVPVVQAFQSKLANNRQLSLRARLGMESPRTPSHNVTCVMQELGYIDQNMEPDYEQIRQRVTNLPVTNELKSDIQDGLQFCQKFSQCVPEDKRDIVPRPQEQIRSIFFFRCYKHKKLEACIMKDINEHFAKEYVLDKETDFGTFTRSARSPRDLPLRDPSLEALEEMEVYLYDYLNGGSGFDFDLYF